MNKELVPQENEIIFYTTPEGGIRIEVLFQSETFWLTLNRIAELFGATKQAISYHLQNIYETYELNRAATVKEISTVQKEGARQVSRNLDYYNLDAVIAVGYRVNSRQATQFRIWATNRSQPAVPDQVWNDSQSVGYRQRQLDIEALVREP
jgi:hypothetical protein